jgi:histone-lysine N-methyltransferase SETMAR
MYKLSYRYLNSVTNEVAEEIGWEMFPHPPYSPDVVWSNLELFRTLEESIEAHKFQHDKQVLPH